MTCGESTISGLSPHLNTATNNRLRLFSTAIAGAILLVHPRPPALDQNEQHNAEQNSGNDANKHDIIHCNSPPFLSG
jgi:hypothetical protein